MFAVPGVVDIAQVVVVDKGSPLEVASQREDLGIQEALVLAASQWEDLGIQEALELAASQWEDWGRREALALAALQ